MKTVKKNAAEVLVKFMLNSNARTNLARLGLDLPACSGLCGSGPEGRRNDTQGLAGG